MKGTALHSGNWGVALKALLHPLPLIEGHLSSEDGGAPHHCYPGPGSPSHFLQGCSSGTDPSHTHLYSPLPPLPEGKPMLSQASLQSIPGWSCQRLSFSSLKRHIRHRGQSGKTFDPTLFTSVAPHLLHLGPLS